MRYPKYYQGHYKPLNPDKYRGKYPLTFRSSWEYSLALFCDKNTSVVEWAMESCIVKYQDPSRNNTIHNYIIDFTVVIKDKNNNIQKYLVEVKPSKETTPPVRGKKSEQRFLTEALTYARNQAKWIAASAFAKSRGAKFIILTERDLFI